MKKLLYLSLLLLTAACSKTVENELSIRFNLNYPGQTRVSGASFESGDVTGLYMTEYSSGVALPLMISGNAADNAALSFDGTLWTASPKVFWDKGMKCDAYGYYPYGAPNSMESYEFSVQQDQSSPRLGSTPGGYEMSDFLWAKSEGVKYPDVVSLNFSHRMSRLVIKLVKGKDFNTELPDDIIIRIHGTVTDALIDLNTGAVEKRRNAVTHSITMRKDGPDTFSAIIVPQRIEKKQPLIEVLTGDVSYLLETRFVFKTGVQHNAVITLNADPDKVRIDIGGEIEGWN